MKKLVVIAGSPNTGKTVAANLTIKKLIAVGYNPSNFKSDKFWEKTDKNGDETYGGSVMLEKDGKVIVVISYGDIVSGLEDVFKDINLDKIDTLVCCSHATRGKKVFDWFHNFIGAIDISKVKILPIYKNLISHHNRNKQENEQIADIIFDWIK